MIRRRHDITSIDDVPPAIVAAIVAALNLAGDREQTQPVVAAWRASGMVAPAWREVTVDSWRERERRRGWSH